MKNILLTIICLIILQVNCLAANWFQLTPKFYIDLNTCKSPNTYISAWFKQLNSGNWNLEKNKKVWYKLTKVIVNTQNNTLCIANIIFYDLKGNVIATYEYNNNEFIEPIPDSIGENYVEVLKILHNKGY